MENITIGQIVSALTILSVIGGFFITIYKLYKTVINNRFIEIEKKIAELEKYTNEQNEEINDSKEERLVLLNGLLACLKGLHDNLNCNGPVTQGIADIENFLIKKTHK